MSPKCTLAPAAHFRWYFVVCDPMWRFGQFHHRPQTPFDDFRTSFRQPIQYRRRTSNDRAVRRSAHISIAAASGHFPAGFSPISRRSRNSTSSIMFVSTDEDRTCRCWRSCAPTEGIFNIRWSTAVAAVQFSPRNCCIASCLTSCRRHSTVIIQLPWCSWIYQQYPTMSTIRFCSRVCELLSASTTQFTGGFSRICFVEQQHMYGEGFSSHQ